MLGPRRNGAILREDLRGLTATAGGRRPLWSIRRRMTTATRWWIWPACLVLLGCPQRTALWLDPDATLNRAVFILGRDQGHPQAVEVGLVRVDECGALGGGTYPPVSSAKWFLEATVEDVSVERLTYGSVPPGFTEASNAGDLELGRCYVVSVTGDGTLRFQVAEDGRLHEAPSP